MRRTNKIICCISLWIIIYSPLSWAGLKIGEEIRIRNINLKNPDSDSSTLDDQNYFSQRVRVYLEGELGQGIEVSVQMQSIGVWGSSTTLLTNLPYSNTDFIPWIEKAYIKLSLNSMLNFNFMGSKWDVVIGRQPLSYVNGLLIDDNGIGKDAVKINGHIGKIETELFTAKAQEKFLTANDVDLSGMFVSYPLMGKNYLSGYYLLEASPVVQKEFFGIKVERNTEEGVFYTIEFIQHGKDWIKDKQLILNLANIIAVGIRNYLPVIGGLGSFKVEYIKGIGETNLTPNYGKKWDGLERAGYGDFYAATFNDVGPGLKPGYANSGIQTAHTQLKFLPNKKLATGFDYFNYMAVNYSTTGSIDRDLGEEYNLWAEYQFSYFLNLRFVYARFNPGKATIMVNSNYTEKICLEVIGKF